VKQLRLAIQNAYKAQGFDARTARTWTPKVWQLPTRR